MRSVADEIRDEGRRRERALSPAERIELALRLGEEDVEMYRTANGVTREEARLRLRRQRQVGRRPSRCAGV
ncbi:MAG TPA: hypothetical protein VLS93_06230 [Anaeromyxobacteraceae bacterium]|nr:hypothetical protein [Anaeromyxobacteraceae bacterium]